MIYMHMPGSDDSSTDTAEEGSSTDTESIVLFEIVNCFKMYNKDEGRKKKRNENSKIVIIAKIDKLK